MTVRVSVHAGTYTARATYHGRTSTASSGRRFDAINAAVFAALEGN